VRGCGPVTKTGSANQVAVFVPISRIQLLAANRRAGFVPMSSIFSSRPDRQQPAKLSVRQPIEEPDQPHLSTVSAPLTM
ncbi:Hypothetical predicted protein, partial [Scomber scombrus]